MKMIRQQARRGILPQLPGALAALAFLLASAARAERTEPPLERLFAPENTLVAGTLEEINPAGRLVFRRREVLNARQAPPDHIDVRVPAEALKQVRVGRRYVFAYSVARPDPRQPTRMVAGADGAVLLAGVGLEPALFADTPALRAVLKAGRDEEGRESDRLYELLMKALAGPDPALQDLAAGQIALDREATEHLREEHGQAAVEAAVRNRRNPPRVRSVLLTAAAGRPEDFGDWWRRAAIEIVTSTSVDGYSTETSDPTDLVLTALELLDARAVTLPSGALERWLRSASPAVAERASLMLRRISPARERSAIQQALADPKLPEGTRRFLDDHLRRLDRLDARGGARKEGSG